MRSIVTLSLWLFICLTYFDAHPRPKTNVPGQVCSPLVMTGGAGAVRVDGARVGSLGVNTQKRKVACSETALADILALPSDKAQRRGERICTYLI